MKPRGLGDGGLTIPPALYRLEKKRPLGRRVGVEVIRTVLCPLGSALGRE